MFVALITLLCFLGFSMQYCREGFHPNYIDKPQCNAVKGFFILLVFLSHFSSYLKVEDRMLIDSLYFFFKDSAGQLIVSLFLFYSGYGVMKSLIVKGRVYVDHMPRKRLLTTVLNFDIAVLSFALLSVIASKKVDMSLLGLSMLGWRSVGNSNWYIFVIVMCYCITWVSARMTDCIRLKFLLLMSTLVFACGCLLSAVKPIYWYDTIMCYVLGMWYSRFEISMIRVLQRNYLRVLFCC